jgi:hypothetical protein
MSNTTRIISNLSELENRLHNLHGEHVQQMKQLIEDCLRAAYEPNSSQPTGFLDCGEPVGFLDSWAATSYR